MRIDKVHHSIALFPTNHAGIQHINHQVETADDIMRSLSFLKENGVSITFGPGRHPSSSAKLRNGVRVLVRRWSIADELLYRERQFPFDPAGFCQWGAKPQIKEFS